MNPLFIALGLLGGGWVAKKMFFDKHPPQSMTTIGPGGVPVKVVTPVSTATAAQSMGRSVGPPSAGRVLPVPTSIPGQGVTYAPPGSVQVTPQGDVHQLPPIVITPTGAASVAVGSVIDIQRGLNTLGYCSPRLVEDGILGPKTAACIKAFQSRNGLTVDGIAGPATKAAVSAALSALAGGGSAPGAAAQNSNPATGQTTSPTGQTIDTSPSLTWTAVQVQQTLNFMGAQPPLVVDGKIGPKSVAAIKSFQTANGLVPDGIAGPKTKAALYLALLQLNVGPPAPNSHGIVPGGSGDY